MQRQIGRPLPELEGPDLPLEAMHIWDWYSEIALGRTSNGFAPNPLNFTEIRSWAALTGRHLRASEARAIILLDQLWREAWVKAEQTRSNQRKSKAEAEARARGGRR